MRRSIFVDGLAHGPLPIPAGSRVGPLVMTGGVRGVNRNSGTMPDTAEAQAELMFDNLLAIVKAAGGSAEDIAKVNVWVAAPEFRSVINAPWLRHFPDPESRPARHVTVHELPAGMLVQCDATAFVAHDSQGFAKD